LRAAPGRTSESQAALSVAVQETDFLPAFWSVIEAVVPLLPKSTWVGETETQVFPPLAGS